MKKRNIKIIVFLFMIMILVAMFDNVRGPFVPTIKNEFSINNKLIANSLFICSFSYMIFTYLGGIFCEKIGQKNVFIVGLIFMTISPIILYYSTSFNVYLFCLFMINIGQALVSIAANTLIPFMALECEAIIMNLIHFSYGVGATATQRFSGLMLYKGLDWRKIYLMVSILSCIILLGFIFVNIPKNNLSKKNDKIEYKVIYKNKIMYFYMIAIGFYVAAEMNTGNWFVNFIHDTYKYNSNKSTFYSALFFGTLTIGRFLGGFIVNKIGYIKSVLISVILALGMYSFGLIIGRDGLVIIALSGLFFSITFPTLILSINKVFKENVSYIIGIVATAGSFGGMIINLLIGTLNDYIGVYKTYYIIPVCLVVSVIFIYLIYRNTREVFIYNRRENNE